MQVMNELAFLFYLAVIVLAVNYIIGLFQEYAPEVLPPILRGNKEMNTYRMTIVFQVADKTEIHFSDISGNSLERAEMAVLDELNKKKFISLETGKVIPTRSILYVRIIDKPEEL